jgi:hypothetical protein
MLRVGIAEKCVENGSSSIKGIASAHEASSFIVRVISPWLVVRLQGASGAVGRRLDKSAYLRSECLSRCAAMTD